MADIRVASLIQRDCTICTRTALESRYRGVRSKLDSNRPSILRFTRQIESFDAIKPCPTND